MYIEEKSRIFSLCYCSRLVSYFACINLFVSTSGPRIKSSTAAYAFLPFLFLFIYFFPLFHFGRSVGWLGWQAYKKEKVGPCCCSFLSSGTTKVWLKSQAGYELRILSVSYPIQLVLWFVETDWRKWWNEGVYFGVQVSIFLQKNRSSSSLTPTPSQIPASFSSTYVCVCGLVRLSCQS